MHVVCHTLPLFFFTDKYSVIYINFKSISSNLTDDIENVNLIFFALSLSLSRNYHILIIVS